MEVELEQAEQQAITHALDALTWRRKAFVREYLKDFNGTRAAIRAGYSAKTAGQIANLLMKEDTIAAAIAQGAEQLEERINITKDKVLSEMTALATSSLDHYIIDDETGQVKLAPGAPENAMSAVQSVKRKVTVRTVGKGEEAETIRTYEVEVKLWDKPTPLKLIGRHVALFPDRIEHTGKDGGPIETVGRIERVIVDPVKE